MRGCWRSAVVALALASAARGQEPPPTADAPRTPLRLDVDKAVDDVMARARSGALPRFEERVEVRDRYQEALDAHLAGVDLECGATSGGPPTSAEIRRFGGAQIPVHADFIAAGRLLYKGLRGLLGSKKPRYYVYAVRRALEVGEYAVREGPLPESVRSAAPEVAWELVAAFHERDDAIAAVERLQRGFKSAQRARADERLPPWVSTTCRPKTLGGR